MKIIMAIIVVLALGAVGTYFFIQRPGNTAEVPPQEVIATSTPEELALAAAAKAKAEAETVIGKSVEGRDITAYHFGKGGKEILFVGGIHGGYSWNTPLVAYQLIDYLTASSSTVPANVRVTVIPVLNPDGLNKVASTSNGRFASVAVSSSASVQEAGRFNAHKVDLNRNFDCRWQANAMWQKKKVSGGTAAFSEPESAALKSYVEAHKPTAVVAWYSAAGGVFASKCDGDILAETRTIMNTFAKAAGYKASDNYDFYEVTGDMVNWFASQGVPAISVLLTTRDATEWDKNKKGVDALLKHFAQ